MNHTLQQVVAVVLLQAGMIVFPGSDWFLVLRHSSERGTRDASIVAVGLGLGSLAVVLLTISGLNVILEVYPLIAKIIRYLGAIWLVWQAIICFYPRMAKQKNKRVRSTSALLSGFINHSFNIEMVLFYIAVISQLNTHGTNIYFQIAVAVEMGLFTTLWFVFVAQVSHKVEIVEKILTRPIARIIIGILFLISAFNLIKLG